VGCAWRARAVSGRSVSGITRRIDDEAARLQLLLEACHDVLPALEEDHSKIADVVRETCRLVEARLQELDVSAGN
jgi:hypothetical protein